MSESNTNAVTLDLQLPLPGQKPAAALRRQIVRHLVQHRPSAGSPLFSELQLMKMTGLSRSTVRRALSPLETAGWIERRQGLGTFAGPRVDLAERQGTAKANLGATSADRRVLRLALVTERLHARLPDPYTTAVLRGLDAVADDGKLSVEIIGLGNDTREAFVRRISRSRPDVIALLAPRSSVGFVNGVAMMFKVPVIGTGDSAADMGLPAVSYEDQDAAGLAVRHLLEHGHQRIALVQQESPQRYVVRRRRGFWNAIQAAGLPVDQNLELWMPGWNALRQEAPAELTDVLHQFLERQKPTAVIFGEGKLIGLLGPLVQAGKVRVPRDISLIAFDQNYADYTAWLGDVRPTVVALPLERVGRRLGELAREVVAGRAPAEPWREPCHIVLGDSVQTPLITRPS